MRKPAKALAAVLAAGIVFTSIAVSASAKKEIPGAAVEKDDFLRAKGAYLVNRSGETVQLRGVNLGGWLTHEQWMCPSDAVDGTDMYNTIYSRFGRQKGKELIDTYLDNWITQADLDNIAAMGLNCVRVPFWYRNFMTEDGEWIYNTSGQPDFSRLDWITEQCRVRGLYVILDMHGAPGFQSIAHHCGKTGVCELFDETEEGERWRRLTVKLWTAIAMRYAGNPTVAAYDLLNEPTCDMNTDEYLDRLMLVYNRLYTAIRAVDPCHVVTMEAIWRLDKISEPVAYGWTNVMYQLHIYNYTDAEIDDVISHIGEYAYYNVPILVGECNAGDSYEYMLTLFNKNAVNWTTWCYKGGFTDSTWFMYAKNFDKPNIHKDNYFDILEKWSEGIRTENMTENTAFTAIIKNAASTPVQEAPDSTQTNILAILKNIICIIKHLFAAWKF